MAVNLLANNSTIFVFNSFDLLFLIHTPCSRSRTFSVDFFLYTNCESAIQYAANRSSPSSSPSGRVLTRNLAALSIIVLFCRRPGTLVHMSVDDLGLDGGPLRLHDEYGSITDVHAVGARSKVVQHFIAKMGKAWGNDLPSKPFNGAGEYSTFFRAVMISAGLRPNESDQFRPYAFRQAASTFDMGDVRTMLEECGGPTLGGGETLEELLELCEDTFGDIV